MKLGPQADIPLQRRTCRFERKHEAETSLSGKAVPQATGVPKFLGQVRCSIYFVHDPRTLRIRLVLAPTATRLRAIPLSYLPPCLAIPVDGGTDDSVKSMNALIDAPKVCLNRRPNFPRTV